jgi:hypothetical protein
MRLRSTAFLFLCVAGAAARASGPAGAPPEMPVYAPVKARICADCPMPKPGFALPRHAVVLGSWGFTSYGSDFQVLDLDSGKLVRAFVPAAQVPTRRAPKPSRSAVKLPASSLPQLRELANRIWAEPQPIRSRDATDTAWDLWLIDGAQIRHETGAGLPDGLAAEWMRRLNRLQGAGYSPPAESVRGK